MKFKNLSDWIMIEHCATRIIIGGDVNKVSDRVAFIEKTPRVKLDNSLRNIDTHIHCFTEQNERGIECGVYSNKILWIYGDKGSSDYGLDENSRTWCDEMLKALGWEVV